MKTQLKSFNQNTLLRKGILFTAATVLCIGLTVFASTNSNKSEKKPAGESIQKSWKKPGCNVPTTNIIEELNNSKQNKGQEC